MDEPQIIRNGESYDLYTREHMDNGVSVHMCLNDTREKLEAELRNELRLVFGGNGGQRYASYKFVQSLLDRQDAITQREFAKAQEKSTLEVMRADAKLRKEVDELRAELETYRKYAEQGKREKSQSEENGDTREQLEAWAHEEIAEKWAQSDREVTMIMDDLLDMLDRQAAITERMASELREKFCALCKQGTEGRIVELSAERDQLKAELARRECLIGALGYGLLGGMGYPIPMDVESLCVGQVQACADVLKEFEQRQAISMVNWQPESEESEGGQK